MPLKGEDAEQIGGEREHPLRADPLQSIPDAVSVPRPRRRPRSPTSSSNTTSTSTSPKHSGISTSSKFFSLAPSEIDREIQEKETIDQFKDTTPNDPLRAELIKSVKPSSSALPPSGKAYASDIDSILDEQEKQQQKLKNTNKYEEKLIIEGQELTNDTMLTDISIYPFSPSKTSDNHNNNNEEQDNNSNNKNNINTHYAASGIYIIESKKVTKLHLNLLTEHEKQQYYKKKNTIEQAIILPSTSQKVGRSISDFHWLYRRLILYYDGIIIPSLPSMSITTRFKNGPLHEKIRLNGLYRFLYRLSIHPILSKGPELLIFTGHHGENEFKHLRSLPLPNKSSFSLLVVDDNDENLWKKLLWQTGKKVNQGLVWLLKQNDDDYDIDEDNHNYNLKNTSSINRSHTHNNSSDSSNGSSSNSTKSTNNNINYSNNNNNTNNNSNNNNSSSSRKKEESGKDRLERLRKYVRELGPGLSSVRNGVNKVIKSKENDDRVLESFENALRDVAKREGGIFATHFGNIGLDKNNIPGISKTRMKSKNTHKKFMANKGKEFVNFDRGTADEEQRTYVQGQEIDEENYRNSTSNRTGANDRDGREQGGGMKKKENGMNRVRFEDKDKEPTIGVIDITMEKHSNGENFKRRKQVNENAINITTNSNTNYNNNSNYEHNNHTERKSLLNGKMLLTSNSPSSSSSAASTSLPLQSPLISPLPSSTLALTTKQISIGRLQIAGRLLEEILEDYEERSKGAQRIMSARQEEQETYERALERYKSLRDELEQNNELVLESVEELETKLTEASRRLGKVRKQYQAVAIRTTDELRRLRKDLHEDLCDGLWLLASEMEKEYKQQAVKWANLANSIEDYKTEIDAN